LKDKIVLDINGEKHWFFHGDVFDVTMQHSKWLAKVGGFGYDMLILVNRFVNFFLEKIGRGKLSLSKKVKDSVKAAVKHINNFERTAAEIAITNEYSHVICGHIHEPIIKEYKSNDGTVKYLNSGDWIENLTCLEYNGEWELVFYRDLVFHQAEQDEVILPSISKAYIEMKEELVMYRKRNEMNLTYRKTDAVAISQ
jgi:UDP-2,3-diacylglucosamine pyrophosphatase LpxH